MRRQELQNQPSTKEPAEAQRLAGVVLVRIAVAGGTEPDVAHDVMPLLGRKPSSDIWRIELGRLISALQAGGLIQKAAGSLSATPLGETAAIEFLGLRKGLPSSWGAAREIALVAKALGLEAAPPSRLKLLAKPDGLRALIVIQQWGLKIKGAPTASRLRSALAVKALERAFGNQIRSGLGDKSALPAKAGRLLAGQLSSASRDFGTDARLVAALAAEAVATPRSDLGSLQLAVLRRFIGRNDAGPPEPRRKRTGSRKSEQAAAAAMPPGHDDASAEAIAAAPPPVSSTPVRPPAPLPLTLVRPDPDGFAHAVHRAADAAAEGWAGNRRAFICKVWERVQLEHPEWALSEIEFKCMLAEAHRTGLVVLANADLKDKRALKELQASAVVYKNTVWHYVRASD